jgi:type IV secretion system protein VirB6
MEPVNSRIFAYLDSRILSPLNAFIDLGVNGLTAYLVGPLAVGITIYVILNGIAFTRGITNETVTEFVMKAIKLAIIFTLATHAADFNYYVKNVFFEYLPNEIGTAIATVNGGDAENARVGASALDSLLSKGLQSGSRMWKLSPNDMSIILYALFYIVIVIATFMMCVFGYVVLFYAKAALSVIIALGPVFIACALFNSTRRFTEAWIGQAVNFVILQILIISIGALLVEAAIHLVISNSNLATAMLGLIQFSVIAICAWYIFLQLPSIASGLAAGGANLAFGGHVYPGTPMASMYRAIRNRGGTKQPDSSDKGEQSGRSDHSSNPLSGFTDGTLRKGPDTPLPTIDPPPAPATPRPGQT